MDIRRAISHAGLRALIRWFAERAPRDGLPIAHGANVSIDSDQALGDTTTPYSAALAGRAVAGALTRRKRSTIRVPAWVGSRSTLASSLDAMAVTMRCPMPVERGSILTLRPTPSSAIDKTRSSPCALRLT